MGRSWRAWWPRVGTRSDAASRSPGATSSPGSAPGSLVESWAIPARSAMIRASSRTCSSGRSSRSSGSAIRSRRMSADVDVDAEQALVVQRRAEHGRAGRGDDLGAAPERDRLVDPDPVAEHRRTTSSAGRRSASACRHDVAVPRPTSLVAARSRPGDDETLMRIWAPSRASSCGTVRCQKSSQMAIPIPTPSRDGTARRTSPGREEPALVEEAVGRQEQLAMDVADLAVLEQGRGDEQPVVGQFLDERHDGRQALVAAASSVSRGSSRRIETSAARSWSW